MRHNNLPEIRIKDAWLLRRNASVYLNELWGDGKKLRSDEEYERIVASYRKAWQPVEQKIITGMCEILDLEFRQNIVDVYIAPWFNAFSEPMVIGVTQKPDEFVDTLTHEILHRLLTDNTSLPYDTKYLSIWRRLFGKTHSFDALIHIPVHAVHKYIYLDVMNSPERLKRDVEFIKKYQANDYLDAWDYVDKHGYNEIIDKLKKSYKND